MSTTEMSDERKTAKVPYVVQYGRYSARVPLQAIRDAGSETVRRLCEQWNKQSHHTKPRTVRPKK